MFAFGIGLVILVVVLLGIISIVTYGVGIYNSLVQVRNNVDKTFNNIDVILQQRHDELPKLVDTCKSYMKYEKEMLDNLMRLREHYGQTNSPEEKAKTENEIGKQLLTLTARMEAYPDLKANKNFTQIQDRISALESTIADRRELFNDSVNIYNIQIERFPHVILARALSYARRDFLEIPHEKKEDVKMDFS
jgi:LemA protein